MTPALKAASEVIGATDPGYLSRQITRMEGATNAYPDLAIGTAKELVESVCKTVLTERGVSYGKNADLPELTKLTVKELQLAPSDIADQAKASIKRLLSNLSTVANGVAELRIHYGTGHGKPSRSTGPSARHARLVVGAASTLAVFLVQTHNERQGR